MLSPEISLLIPTPAWANHVPLCKNADIAFEEFAALDEGKIQHDVIIDRIQKSPNPCAVLLQSGCTHPTGIDLTREQWSELIPVLQEKQCIVVLDFAYQGFGNDPEADAAPARMLLEAGIPILISWSASKNHSIYRLRTGLALANVSDQQTKELVEGYYSMLSRGLWSVASDFGQKVVTITQQSYEKEWLDDLAKVRDVLQKKRSALQTNLPSEFQSALNGNGMFAVLPLSMEQIESLRKDHHVFILDDGRMNIAGIREDRLAEFCEKVNAIAA